MSKIESLAPSQQLELVEAKNGGASWRDLEKYCMDKFGVQISHETIRYFFDHALNTMPSNVRELKASAIIGLHDQMDKYKALIDEVEARKMEAGKNNDKAKLAVYADMTKLLLGVISLKPDMPMPTTNATPNEASITETKKWHVTFAKEPQDIVVEGEIEH